MSVKTLIIANIAEAFEDTIDKISNSKKKKDRISIEHNLCDRTLLWEGDNKIIITPYQISKTIFSINNSILGFKNVQNLYPAKVNVSLSEAIMNDSELLNKICCIIRDNPGIKISPYCVTEKFVLLVEHFKKRKLKFTMTEMPDEKSRWLVSYLDSKIGSRTEISKIKSIYKNVPESVVCRNQKEAVDVVLWFYENNNSCVLKANLGESGWGAVFIKKEYFKNSVEVKKYIKNEFQLDSIWDNELILVEKYKVPGKKISGGSPSSELFLSEKGAKITYLCDQIIGSKGDFFGVALGNDLMNSGAISLIRKISLKIGRRFWRLGYRGFFDIDFVLSDNNIPYIIETNMRRTGGTHVYDVAKRIFGNKWENDCFVISQDNFNYGKKKLDEKQIIAKMKELVYPIKGKKEGVIISIVDIQKPIFGFIIVSNSRKKSLTIYNKILNVWKIKN